VIESLGSLVAACSRICTTNKRKTARVLWLGVGGVYLWLNLINPTVLGLRQRLRAEERQVDSGEIMKSGIESIPP